MQRAPLTVAAEGGGRGWQGLATLRGRVDAAHLGVYLGSKVEPRQLVGDLLVLCAQEMALAFLAALIKAVDEATPLCCG